MDKATEGEEKVASSLEKEAKAERGSDDEDEMEMMGRRGHTITHTDAP